MQPLLQISTIFPIQIAKFGQWKELARERHLFEWWAIFSLKPKYPYQVNIDAPKPNFRELINV